jgi:hypothetical protein
VFSGDIAPSAGLIERKRVGGKREILQSLSHQPETFEWRLHFSTAASISRRNDGAFLQRVAAAVTSQVDRWSYYIDLLRNGCSGDGTDLEGPRHGLPRNGRASGADLRDDVMYSSLSLTTIPEREYGRQSKDSTTTSCNEPGLRHRTDIGGCAPRQ